MRRFMAMLFMWSAVSFSGTAPAQDELELLTRFFDCVKSDDDAGLVAIADKVAPVLEARLAREPKLLAMYLGLVAKACEGQGRYAQAESLIKRALAISEQGNGPDHPDTASMLIVLGNIYLHQARYPEAEPLIKRALRVREKTFGPDDPATAVSLNSLAIVLLAQGQHDQAEPLLKRSLKIRETALGPDHGETAESLNNLAEFYRRLGNYSQAERYMERALAIYQKVLGPDHPDTAIALNNLALLHDNQGHYGPAEQLYKKSLECKEKSLGPDHSLTALTICNLALLYHQALGRYREAEPLYQRSLAIYEKVLGPDHPSTALTLDNLAWLEAARGRFAEAAALFDRSRRGTRRHVARVLPALSAFEQTVFLRTNEEAKFHAALALGLLQKSSPQIAALSAGWLANGKAVAQEAASQQVILARQSENPATQAAVAALTRVRADLAKLSQVTLGPDQAVAYREMLSGLVSEEQRLVHEIGGQLAALERDEPWIDIDAIRKNIPAAGVLVDIARFDIFDFAAKGTEPKWRPARYAAWIVPPSGEGDVTILDLGTAEEIDAGVAAYREAIDAVQKGGFKRGQDAAEQELKITSAPLTQKVLQPILDAIGSATEIVLSPDGALWLLPWQALPLGDGSYAIEKYSLRAVTSARDLVPVPVEPKGSRGGPVVVADPAFDSAPAAPAEKPAPDRSRSFAPATDIARRFGRLPNTRSEAVASGPVLTKLTGSEPKVLLGPEASEANLRRAAVRPRTVVLATHGFFKADQDVKRDDAAAGSLAGAGSGIRGATRAVTTTGEALEDPLLRCGLALAGANVGAKAADGDDGILTGAEIVGLDLLGTDLVVLSACETGVGTVKNGEGVAGLRQAFQIAGAKSVVATLWQVPDAESAQIMAAFYANLAAGQAPAQALRGAQLGFIKARREDRNYEAAHPYLWAAYGVTGR